MIKENGKSSPDFVYATESMVEEENEARMKANASPSAFYTRELWRKVTVQDLIKTEGD